MGGPIDRTSAGLRIIHEDLDPDLITRLLNCEPTRSRRKGDIIPSTRHQRVAVNGAWFLNTPRNDTGELETQINGLLNQVSDDLSVWEQLSGMYRIDVFCGLHLNEWNRGFSLSAGLIRRLAERNLTVGFDIYCDAEEDAEPSVEGYIGGLGEEG